MAKTRYLPGMKTTSNVLRCALLLGLGLGASCAHETRALRMDPALTEALLAENAPSAPQQDSQARSTNGHSHRATPMSGGAMEVGIGLGRRNLDDVWGEADEMFNYFALDLTAQPRGWPFELTMRLMTAGVSDRPAFATMEVERADLTDIDVGLRIPLEFEGGTRLTLGGGVAWIEATLSDDDDFFDWDLGWDEVDRDKDVGWWAGAGLALPIGGGHSLAFDSRWTDVDLVLEGSEVPAGGWTFLVSWVFRHRFQ